ncbi:MAG: tRNA lysidine(34) synthetase TilS [Gaiella sp.]
MSDPLLDRVARHVEQHGLLPGGVVTCLVSGGADSTCLWHSLGSLGHEVRAVHVHHGVRGAAADADAEHCATAFEAEIVRIPPGANEAELRRHRYEATARFGLRATGHTASDQVETLLYRLLSSGSTRGIRVRRADGVVRPLLHVWRTETEAYCERHRLPVRTDETNPETMRGRIRSQLLPLLRELEPRAEANLLALAGEQPRLPRALEASLVELLSSRDGTKVADLGHGLRGVRAYDELRIEGEVAWGPWRISTQRADLVVRSRRPGDRLAGRRKKVQDVLVDAKVPRAERDAWPVVAGPEGVVAVPGLAVAPGHEGDIVAERVS